MPTRAGTPAVAPGWNGFAIRYRVRAARGTRKSDWVEVAAPTRDPIEERDPIKERDPVDTVAWVVTATPESVGMPKGLAPLLSTLRNVVTVVKAANEVPTRTDDRPGALKIGTPRAAMSAPDAAPRKAWARAFFEWKKVGE